MTRTLADVIARLEQAYPVGLAESWDAVGLVCGDPDEPAERVLVCVDVTDAVVDEAVATGAQLVLAHHPLLMRGVTGVGADTPKGRIVHRLIRSGCGLYSAHTNADKARPGVSDALADAIGLVDTVPLNAEPSQTLDKWVVMVPEGNVDQVSEAMFAAGAGAIGDYRDCRWGVVGTGQFLPVGGASPAIGGVGELTRVDEERMEMVAPRRIRSDVFAALAGAHPYEEPAFDVFEQAAVDSGLGLGRIGRLPVPMRLDEFVAHVDASLPTAAWPVRGAGDPAGMIETVAVCGGAGDSLVSAASRAGVDAYVTGDLRHHVVDEARRDGAPALIDAGHWSTEYPWCAQAAALLTDFGCETNVFAPPTDPFGVVARRPL
ncbi:Nif3-like dinuclear metal center hexameric protein [Gordonia sp. HY442]|uniref:Nif3-like dinuclear metal center hexameric protein n=1 Tax=Gordonia zhenghanii TaxID=2911516 RepID=UPI001F01409A|nr:Nif3-like dinuclear metal center hexameric protein [Gordonia zhenghanii]MCF8607895.1 Nif3-like dinuclear metal center hexameric protein [Gordonia zhenghanii]